jgi:predicted lipoprotein with Yx(FWY)xxD motif
MQGVRPLRPARTAGLVVAVALVALLAACGDGNDAGAGDTTPTTEAPESSDKTPTTIVADGTAVTIAETALGSVLVDAGGFTLYAFLNDGPNVSNCSNACAQTWPPLVVDGEFGVGLIGAGFTTATRADGSTQLVVDQRPLYRFSGDQAPGDTNGQGVNGKWFAVDASGRLLDGSNLVDVAGSRTALGDVLVDGHGGTLYAFLDDTNGVSSCNDECATKWPPLVLDGSVRVGDGVTSAFGTTTRADGTVQLTAAGHPLYRFSGDRRPGDVKGQNVGGKWFVVDLAGGLVQPGA